MQHNTPCSQTMMSKCIVFICLIYTRSSKLDDTVCNSLAAFVLKVKPISSIYTSIIHFSAIRIILCNLNKRNNNNFILNQFINKIFGSYM